MADVSISIGGRPYTLHCRDGEEEELYRLAALVDGKVALARESVPGITEVRQLLFAALFLADELEETKRRRAAPAPAADDEPAARALESLAVRLESLAERLAPTPSLS